MMCDLDDIFIKYKTDKSSEYHNYSAIYDPLFTDMRKKNGKLLEIGVFNGSSLKSWEEYFPNFKIYGLDINPDCKKYETERSKVIIGSAGTPFYLSKISNENGPFDIVVDDGSHLANDILTSYNQLFPLLNSNGLYCIEDLHCNDKSYSYSDYTLLSKFIEEEVTSFIVERNKKIKQIYVYEKMIIFRKL